MGRRIGSVIGAVGGVLFVLVNAGAVGVVLGPVLRIAAIFVLVLIVVRAVFRAPLPGAEDVRPSRGALRTYGISVAAEAVAIPVGALLLNRVLGLGDLTLCWVVLVVGAHFWPFARAFGAPIFGRLAIALMVVALVGAAVTLTVDVRGSAWTGVLAGFALLSFSAYALFRRAPRSGPDAQRTESRRKPA